MRVTTAVKHISSPQSEEMITSYINNHPEGVITTLNKKGVPQSSVVNLFQIDNYHMAFMTKKTTRKYKNLSTNNAVSYLTYDPFSRTEVEIEGIALAVDNPAQQDEIIHAIADDARNGKRHISPYVSSSDDYALYVIYPRKMHMTTYWERQGGAESFHESIEFDLNTKD